MSRSTSSYTASIGEGSSNQFRVPPPNMAQQVTSTNLYNQQMNAAYYPYAAYSTPDQWVLNQAYYYNSWSYPQPPNTPPATLMQTPPPPLGTPPFPPNFNPGQPPPPPSEPPKMQPPPPPDTLTSPPKRGKSIYPRGGRNVAKGSNRHMKPNDAYPNHDSNRLPNAGGDADNSLSSVNTDTHQVQIHKKPKRKPMSSRYTRKRAWCREDAEKVLELENQSSAPATMLVIHFPDPDLNSHMVKGFSPDIESVHFQIPYKARSCFVKLRPGADLEKVCDEISKIPFGTGFLRAEEKYTKHQENLTNCEGIDPYTLYVGNLPANITVSEVKENFPTATYIDVGFAQKMKYTRYAFIQYATVEEAMDAYKKTINLMLDKRNLVVRFRRTKGNMGLPGDARQPTPKKTKEHDSDCEIIGDDGVFPKPVEEGNPDSKDNVLREAAKLMRKMLERGEDFALFDDKNDTSMSNGPIVNIKTEKNDEENDDSSDDLDDDNDLLGTQIKDEPPDEFDNVDDCYSDVNEEEDDEIPPEYNSTVGMDDITFPNVDDDLDNDMDNWDEIRRKELEEVEEKPDISTLESNCDTVKAATSRPALSLSGLASEKQDGLDDLFRAMNPESDDDDNL